MLRRTKIRAPGLPSAPIVILRQGLLPALALLIAFGSATGASAADDSPWRVSADRVFRPVARNADLPAALIPVTMAEDANGFLWLGGDGGLLRWDGYQFRNHRADPALRDGLRVLNVWTLHRDPQRGLWAGMSTGGLARYDPRQDRLVCIKLSDHRCGTQHVWAIEDDGVGGLWIGTSEGLFRLRADGTVMAQWHHTPGKDGGLPDEEVLALLRDHRGVLWIGTKNGLAHFVPEFGSFAPVRLQGAVPGTVAHVLEDSDGRIWIGTRQQGAYVLDADRERTRLVAATAPVGVADIATEITAMLEITPGRVWIGTSGRGIVEVDCATLRTQRIVHDPFVPNGLADDTVQALYRDQSGLIWVATEDGLAQYNSRDTGIMTFFGTAGRKEGLPGEGVMSVLPAPDGSLWAGLQGNGFAVLDPSGRRVTGLDGYRIFSLALAPAGGVLMGTDGGMFLADPSGRHVKRLTVPQLSPTLDIHELRTVGGSVWLALRDGGLWQLRIAADGAVTVLRHLTAPTLTNSVVEVVASAPNGRLAIGTDYGLNLLDLNTGAVERILPDPASPMGLDAGFTSAFATDHHGRLWIATNSGLDILLGRDAAGRPRFRRLGVADGLPSGAVDALLVDANGSVWASTDMGMAVIDPDSFGIRAFQRADGLAITNYWTASAAVMMTGELVFGGIGGLTMVRPASLADWDYRPPVVVTDVRVGGRPITVDRENAPTIVVPANENNLEVEFAALDFSAPARNRYSYKLDGFDDNWSDRDAEHRVAAYTNLPPGNYTLRLRGSNRNGAWTEPDTIRSIHVLPAWYQTVWFRLLAVGGAAFLVAALLRASTAILRRRQRVLERQVAEQTAELRASEIKLRHANAGLEMRVAERTHTLAERTAALESSEARFRAWFDNAEDAVFVVQAHPDGRLVFEAVNAAVERIFGIPASAYPGRQPTEVWPYRAATEVLERCREAAAGGAIQFETRITLHDVERVLDSWIVAVRDPVTGQVRRLIGASRDMTERRALEERLAQAQKLQALGGLAGGIAHDFNNILQAVAGAALLTEQSLGDHEKIRRLSRRTIAAAERGASITKRLLAFARSDDLRVEAIATADVLEGLHEVLTYTLGSSITVRTSFPAGLPPLLADRGQLETALVNLGTNARDAMGGAGVLTLSAEAIIVGEEPVHPADLASGAYVRIDVADTGSGMDAATVARAVEPFFTTKPQGQGTGLGLALVKGFTEQSGGGMAIESTPGHGTTISLWLRQAAVGALSSPVKTEDYGRHGTSSGCILVVDDDDLVRETVVPLLEGAGFSVVAASSGAEAVELTGAGLTPDALVCDLSMPGMNGLETIRRLRELRPGLPCFLLTGYAGEGAALESGDAFRLLYKPISAAALIAEIEAGLSARRG